MADLEAQLLADLEAVSLSDDDYDGDPPPLPAVVALAPIEQLIADAEESACDDAPVDGPLARLSAMLEAGDRARGRYMAEVTELQELVADLPAQASAPAADAAAPAAEAFLTSVDPEEDSVEEPWWVAERKEAWNAEAERDAQREQAAQTAAAEREQAGRAAQAAARREAAAVAAKLEEEQAALRAAQEEQLRERERQQLLARQRQQATHLRHLPHMACHTVGTLT